MLKSGTPTPTVSVEPIKRPANRSPGFITHGEGYGMFYLYAYRCQQKWWLTTSSTSIIACHVGGGEHRIHIPPSKSMQIWDHNMTIHIPCHNHKLYRHILIREANISTGININFAKCFVITFWRYRYLVINDFEHFFFHFKLKILTNGCFHAVATFRSRIVWGEL